MSDNLVVEGLRIPAVSGSSLRRRRHRAPSGRVTALLGANGAGKSSFVLGVAGVLPSLAGSVRLGGIELARQGAAPDPCVGIAAVPEGHRVLTD